MSLASVKSRLVLPFWYRLTWVVPEKGPLNGCVCVICVRHSRTSINPVYSAANRTCPKGYALCYGSRQCVLAYFFDDGENDCNVGTDEFDQFLGIHK